LTAKGLLAQLGGAVRSQPFYATCGAQPSSLSLNPANHFQPVQTRTITEPTTSLIIIPTKSTQNNMRHDEASTPAPPPPLPPPLHEDDPALRDIMEFFPFGFFRQSGYTGTVVYHLMYPSGVERAMTVRVAPRLSHASAYGASSDVASVDVVVTCYLGLPADKHVDCAVSITRDTFLDVYSGRMHPMTSILTVGGATSSLVAAPFVFSVWHTAAHANLTIDRSNPFFNKLNDVSRSS
jgi:hypothetical protein